MYTDPIRASIAQINECISTYDMVVSEKHKKQSAQVDAGACVFGSMFDGLINSINYDFIRPAAIAAVAGPVLRGKCAVYRDDISIRRNRNDRQNFASSKLLAKLYDSDRKVLITFVARWRLLTDGTAIVHSQHARRTTFTRTVSWLVGWRAV